MSSWGGVVPLPSLHTKYGKLYRGKLEMFFSINDCVHVIMSISQLIFHDEAKRRTGYYLSSKSDCEIR